MVNAWVTASPIGLDQAVGDEAGNETTAVPKLLEIPEFSGCIVAIDAMDCQTEIAAKIKDGHAGCCLVVKDNRSAPYQGVQAYFAHPIQDYLSYVKSHCHGPMDSGHGRQEHHQYYLCPAPTDRADRERWEGMPAIGVVIQTVGRVGKTSSEVRSIYPEPVSIGTSICGGSARSLGY